LEKIQITIIGGGVVGCAIAWQLSKRHKDIFVFEKNPFLGDEQSGRNSGVIHAGIYYKNEPLKQKLCVRGKELLYDFCEKNSVPAFKTGKFIVAVKKEDEKFVEGYLAHAKTHSVPAEIVDERFVKKREPNVNCHCALWSPTTGIVDPAGFLKALSKLAGQNGVEFLTSAEIVGITPQSGDFLVKVKYKNGEEESFISEIVINSAGLYSDKIARMINPESPYEIVPVRGEYYYFNSSLRKDIHFNGTNVYQVQKPYYIDGREYQAIGIHLTPTFEKEASSYKISSKVIVGPTSIPVCEKDNYSKNRLGPEKFYKGVKDFFPNLKISDLKMDYAGNRAKLKIGNDFVIEKDHIHSGAINLIGIDSPGLTSSLAIAEYIQQKL